MADQSKIQCPLCGKAVQIGTPKCPFCSTDLTGVKPRKVTERTLKAPHHDFLKKDIPKVVLPEAKHSCPLCALELKGKESKCPRCGVPLSIPKEEEKLQCPQCSFLAPIGTKSCPKCGMGFEEVPGPPPAEELPPPPEPMAPEPAPEPVPEPAPERPIQPAQPAVEAVTRIPPPPPSYPKGLVNGRGATNGTGLVNGRGAVNGTGLVNGTGMINGTKGETRARATKKQRLFITRWQFLAVLIALLVVIPTFLFLSYSKEPRAFAVDGDFGEWSKAGKFGVYVQASSLPIAVSEWSVVSEGSRLFAYINAAGDIMSSTEVSSYYLFIDSDNSEATGYALSGIGADYLLQLDGWNSTVQSTSLSEYGSNLDDYDWNSWDSIGSLSAAISGTELETMAELSFSMSESARFLLMTQNSAEQRAISYTVPEKGGLLVVEMEEGVGMAFEGLVESGPAVSMARLYLTAEGEGGTVQSITPTVAGGVLVSPIENLELDAGDTLTVDVLVDTSSLQAGSLVTVSLGVDDVASEFEDVQIIGDQIKAYVTSAPLDIQIDGAFADWDGLTTDDVDISGPNENIDISAVGAVNGTSHSSFYVSVVGEMCGGSSVPVIKEKPSGGGGGIVIPSRKTGEDILRIFIDSDVSSSTGQVVTLSSKIIGADYVIEIKGLNGKIVEKSLKNYSDQTGQWGPTSATINAAVDQKQLEVNVSSSSIGGSSSIDFIVETTDWRLRTDLATAVPLGAESLAGGVPSGASILSWAIESPTSSSSATAMSYQRKLFYDGVNFWSFYFDGTTTVYRYSTDGITWNLVGPAFSGSAINEASLWYDSSSNTVYIVGDTAAASRTVHVRSGVVFPATHTITWGVDSTPSVSTVALGGKNTYISKDRTGYVWLASTNCTQVTPTRYDLSVFVSTMPDSVTFWQHSGNMLAGVVGNQPNIKGSVVNIGVGSDMLAVFTYGGNVASRVLTTSWSAMTTIYAIGAANPENTDNAPPSVVVDNRGVAHVVYGNGHEQTGLSLPFIYYVYYRGSSWSVSYRLDSAKNNEGNFYPTISVDSSTGNVFAFWVETTGGVGLSINAKKNVTGTWSSFTVSSDITSPKQYLTSIYSAPNENAMCWQWTQNTTGTIEVQFDKIPEFSEVALPVLGLVAVVVIGHRKRASRRSKDSTKD